MLGLSSHYLEGVESHSQASELVTRHPPLKLPQITVHVEDAAPQQIAEDRREGFPFGVVLEPSFEHVFNIIWVRSDCVSQNMNMDRLGGRVTEQMRVPVAQIVEFGGPARPEVDVAYLAAAPRPYPH